MITSISLHLTSIEWDACFYAAQGKHRDSVFSNSIKRTIKKLREEGYVFKGLTEDGEPGNHTVESNNADKLFLLSGEERQGIDFLDVLDSGRKFLKIYCPDLVDEDDVDWNIQKGKVRSALVCNTMTQQ